MVFTILLTYTLWNVSTQRTLTPLLAPSNYQGFICTKIYHLIFIAAFSVQNLLEHCSFIALPEIFSLHVYNTFLFAIPLSPSQLSKILRIASRSHISKTQLFSLKVSSSSHTHTPLFLSLNMLLFHDLIELHQCLVCRLYISTIICYLFLTFCQNK